MAFATYVRCTTLGVVLFVTTSTGMSAVSLYDFPLSAPKILDFVLLKNTMSDVFTSLGKTEKYRDSGEEDAPDKICYHSIKDPGTFLVFESGSSGGWTELTGFTLTTVQPKSDSVCASTNAFDADLKIIEERLSLGMTKKEVIYTMGKPGVRNLDKWKNLPKDENPDHWVYLTTWSVSQTGANGNEAGTKYDAWTNIELVFENSKLISVHTVHGMTD